MMKRWTTCMLQAVVLLAVMTLAAAVAVRAADDSKILKKDELKNLVANAKAPQDHERLAAHFTAKAEQMEADAAEHEALAAQYRANPNMHEMKHPGSQQTYSHCVTMAKNLRDAAKQARQLAEDHQAMAKQTK